jgi:hypothetical protein
MNDLEITTENLNIGEVYFDKVKHKTIGELKYKTIAGYNETTEKKPYYKLVFQKEVNTTIILIRDHDSVFFKEI